MTVVWAQGQHFEWQGLRCHLPSDVTACLVSMRVIIQALCFTSQIVTAETRIKMGNYYSTASPCHWQAPLSEQKQWSGIYGYTYTGQVLAPGETELEGSHHQNSPSLLLSHVHRLSLTSWVQSPGNEAAAPGSLRFPTAPLLTVPSLSELTDSFPHFYYPLLSSVPYTWDFVISCLS